MKTADEMPTKDINVIFPGGKRVDAQYGGLTVKTDQSVENGGDVSAPAPFDLFFVSIATCVGIYLLGFCTARKLSVEGLGLRLVSTKNEGQKLYEDISLIINAPRGFPDKYRSAFLRAANLCTVKKHIVNSPKFEIMFGDQSR